MKPFRPLASALALVALLPGGFAQKTAPSLAEAVRDARTVPVAPKKAPPPWMDDDRLKSGFAFMAAHRATMTRILVGSSLAATFAAKDVEPVLMETGKLPKSFTPRMMATGLWMNAIMTPSANREGFLSGNYARAVALGELHAAVAQGVREPLGWDPKVRVPMNGQSYAFVLYSFAWWPVEAMVATKEIDSIADHKALEDWFHLWSVVGYGMGVPEALLPTSLARARETVALLRKAQYGTAGPGVPTLLGGHVRMLAGMAKGPVGDAAKALADAILLSPGLAEALGLGADPAARLAEYAAIPAPK